MSQNNKIMKRKKVLKIIITVLAVVIIVGLVSVIGINAYVINSTKKQIIAPENEGTISKADCILVLGCGLKGDGTPSDMLRDRLDRGIELYNLGVADKILMTGDHGRVNYNEVGTMKQYATDKGIPAEDVFMDHAGFSTYESIYRAKSIFEADNIVIVTQEYHLYRALHIANALDVSALGVNADYHTYRGQFMRDAREILARNKDFITTIFKPKPTYLGDKIPVSGDGNQTNDY